MIPHNLHVSVSFWVSNTKIHTIRVLDVWGTPLRPLGNNRKKQEPTQWLMWRRRFNREWYYFWSGTLLKILWIRSGEYGKIRGPRHTSWNVQLESTVYFWRCSGLLSRQPSSPRSSAFHTSVFRTPHPQNAHFTQKHTDNIQNEKFVKNVFKKSTNFVA